MSCDIDLDEFDEDGYDECEEPDYDSDDGEDDTDACPYCGAQIYEDADICPHCGSFVFMQEIRTDSSPWMKWTAWTLLILILFGFLLYVNSLL